MTFAGIGKKGRWVQAVRVMADPAARVAVIEAIFNERPRLVCVCARKSAPWCRGAP